MTAYYNEIDANAAAWLRELIKQGLIADGVVDERSIEEIKADDLKDFEQCHFFAGIGGWSYALRNAGWADATRVWTGSCPCQSFSASGKRQGFDDKRHLWPAWFRLIAECRPDVIFGEQVASKDGLAWFDVVSTDLENAGYTVGAADLCAAGFGAPHIRQRLYFVGEPNRARSQPRCKTGAGMGHRGAVVTTGGAGDMGDTKEHRHEGRAIRADGKSPQRTEKTSFTNGYWRDAEWLYCTDQKYRPTQPGIFPLVASSPSGVVRSRNQGTPFHPNESPEARVMRLRGYGNAINAEVAKAFIQSYLEVVGNHAV